jgi:hypothetical protein
MCGPSELSVQRVEKHAMGHAIEQFFDFKGAVIENSAFLHSFRIIGLGDVKRLHFVASVSSTTRSG